MNARERAELTGSRWALARIAEYAADWQADADDAAKQADLDARQANPAARAAQYQHAAVAKALGGAAKNVRRILAAAEVTAADWPTPDQLIGAALALLDTARKQLSEPA